MVRVKKFHFYFKKGDHLSLKNWKLVIFNHLFTSNKWFLKKFAAYTGNKNHLFESLSDKKSLIFINLREFFSP